MYCSSCGASVAQGLSYCNHCGAKFSAANGVGAIKSPGVKPELLVSAMVGGFIFGLLAIAVLIGVMKQGAGFDLPILLAMTIFCFMLLLLVEGVLIRMLLKGQRGVREARDNNARLREQTTQELGEAQ